MHLYFYRYFQSIHTRIWFFWILLHFYFFLQKMQMENIPIQFYCHIESWIIHHFARNLALHERIVEFSGRCSFFPNDYKLLSNVHIEKRMAFKSCNWFSHTDIWVSIKVLSQTGLLTGIKTSELSRAFSWSLLAFSKNIWLLI